MSSFDFIVIFSSMRMWGENPCSDDHTATLPDVGWRPWADRQPTGSVYYLKLKGI